MDSIFRVHRSMSSWRWSSSDWKSSFLSLRQSDRSAIELFSRFNANHLACVAIERTFISAKQLPFDRKKTKASARRAIALLLLLISISTIQDPIFRQLFDEDRNGVKRIWCIVKYSSVVNTINIASNMIHLIVPFIINLVSPIVIIIMAARQRANVQTQQTYREILYQQYEQHEHLIVGPVVLVILGIPRLAITFVSDCMKSAQDSWLFLCG